MSSISFHFRDRASLRVSGRDRHFMGAVVNDALESALMLRSAVQEPHPLLPYIIGLPDYVRIATQDQNRLLRTALIVDSERIRLKIGSESLNIFELALNTVMAAGSDPIRLCARLHGQCEIHAWVDGPNRAWLSSVIHEGRTCGILREPFGYDGWEAVAEALNANHDHPVVTSYSVTESFPNEGIADFTPRNEGDEEEWYQKPHEEKWDLAIAGLRAKGCGLEMRPDQWADFRFGDSYLNGYQAMEIARKLSEK